MNPLANGTIALTRNRTMTSNRKWALALASVFAIVGGLIAATLTPTPANSAIAGVTKLLDKSQEKITSADEGCDFADYCRSYSLTLADKQVLQVLLENPTADANMYLYDSFGNRVTYASVYASETEWMNISIQNDGATGIGVAPVVSSGKYTLVVGSDKQFFYSVYAFTIPNHLKTVSTNSTTTGTFTSRTTQMSGKSSYYVDGVAFRGNKGAKITVAFTKPGDSSTTVRLYDSFRNELTESSSQTNNTVTIQSFTLPYADVYQVVIEGSTQGSFTLKLSQYVKPKTVKVTKVKLNKKTVTLKLKKSKTAAKPTVTLKATVSPAKATNKKVTWKSSKPKVAKVSKTGKVTGLKAGKATITVTTKNGKKVAKTKIVVKKAKK